MLKEDKLKELNIDILPTYDDIEIEDISNLQRDIIANRISRYNIDKDSICKYYYNNLKLDLELDKLKDIDKAANLLKQHIESNNHIVIATDRDADGINAGCVLYIGLRDIFNVSKLECIVNRRKAENGMSKYVMDRIGNIHSNSKVDLVISSDHGSVDEPSWSTLKSMGIDSICTDHHQVDYNNYPNSATVFINNQRNDSEYFKDVSGCQIAFLLLVKTFILMYPDRDMRELNKLLPYVAITVISDVMSLDNVYNRYTVITGLQEMNSYKSPVWLAIKKLLDITGDITYKDIQLRIAALINTANRTHNEDVAFNLLTANDIGLAYEYGAKLNELNNVRKSVTFELTKVANKKVDLAEYSNSIVSDIDCNFAINGIVASNLGYRYKLPSICFLNNGYTEHLAGSARAIVKDVSVLDIIKNINTEDNSILIKYGGHKEACGCSIHKDKLNIFKTLFDKYSKQQLDTIDRDDRYKIDKILDVNDINLITAYEVHSIGPYGKDWDEPLFLSMLTIDKIVNKYGIARITFNNNIYAEVYESNINLDFNTLLPNDKFYVIYALDVYSKRGIANYYLDIKEMIHVA